MNLESIRTFLQGKKTYFIAAIGAGYVLGIWLGFWAFDEKVVSALGIGSVATLAAKINRNAAPLLLLCAGLALATGCAMFQTTQKDQRYEGGKKTGKITTRATAFTFWESKSALANFKASQTEKTQGASVGSLNQEGGGTNTAATVSALAELLRALNVAK